MTDKKLKKLKDKCEKLIKRKHQLEEKKEGAEKKVKRINK